jgi:hypothetical protein
VPQLGPAATALAEGAALDAALADGAALDPALADGAMVEAAALGAELPDGVAPGAAQAAPRMHAKTMAAKRPAGDGDAGRWNRILAMNAPPRCCP